LSLGSKFNNNKIQLNEKRKRSAAKTFGSSFSKTEFKTHLLVGSGIKIVFYFVTKRDAIMVKLKNMCKRVAKQA